MRIYRKHCALTFINSNKNEEYVIRLQLGQEVRINVHKPLQIYIRFALYTWPLRYTRILCVFEGILNKAGGIHIRSGSFLHGLPDGDSLYSTLMISSYTHINSGHPCDTIG